MSTQAKVQIVNPHTCFAPHHLLERCRDAIEPRSVHPTLTGLTLSRKLAEAVTARATGMAPSPSM